MVDKKHVFQMSGMDIPQKKGKLIIGIQKLGGKYIGGSVYKQGIITHLIVTDALASEKFLAACAEGIWIVTPEYVLESVKKGSWLPEEPYELDVVSWTPGASNPVRMWREKVASGTSAGAFDGWSVLLMIDEPDRRGKFKRILESGKACVYTHPPLPHTIITHVLAKQVSEHAKFNSAPCYPLTHVAQHLFGDPCSDMDSPLTEEDPALESEGNIAEVSSELEMALKDYIFKLERRKRLVFPEFLNYHHPTPHSQAVAADFSNVRSLTECGFFTQALEEIQSSVFPGRLPPALLLTSLMQHALQGEATPYFLCTFWNVLHKLLRNNPSWGSATNTKYFSQLLQCPQCKRGLWAMVDSSLRYSMSGEATCHSLPSPASPELLGFHGNLQAFVLKLFQCELSSANTRESGGQRSSVLYGSFWNVWERSTLGSRSVKQLAQFLVQASVWELSASQEDSLEWDRRQKLVLGLQDMLSAVVEYWCGEHYKLNRCLMEKGLDDLAEHIAILCQDLSPDVLTALVPRMPSSRLKMLAADAIFRNVCCRHGLPLGVEPLSLRKVVSSYLPALRKLCRNRPGGPRAPRTDGRGPRPGSEPPAHSCSNQGSTPGMPSGPANGSGLGKENIPRGLKKVNAAGETLLHRACKMNQVKTVLQILSLPGTDVNIEDHAGWTPLHEACNHGSTACVEALLNHFPSPHLNSQVGGVSPLHDALLNGHVDIAKMLLQHAGSTLLQQRDRHGCTALDLVPIATLREELQRSAEAGDCALEELGSEVRDLAFLEACTCLLSCLLGCYHLERGVPMLLPQAQHQAPSLGYRLAQALETYSLQTLTSSWADPRLVCVVEDVETILGVEKEVAGVCQAVRECQGAHTRFLMGLLEELKAERHTYTQTHS
ncbi:SMC5-SMC6 complex localization factor protein 1 isoform X1 [Osmerus eperlanus]|uniref:SMC5-SMC6 complex localization factor protein 1 isoform X1 n=2 Tax=Osmerus eperlanus TaxID=29151 RepID=UPI002E1261A7